MEELTNDRLGAVPNLSSTFLSDSSWYTDSFGYRVMEILQAQTGWSATESWDVSHEKEPLPELYNVSTHDDVDFGTGPLRLQVYYPTDIGTDYHGSSGSGTQHYILHHLRVGFCSESGDGSGYFYGVDYTKYFRYIKYYDYYSSNYGSLEYRGIDYNYLEYFGSVWGEFQINPLGLADMGEVEPFKYSDLGIAVLPVYVYQGLESSGSTMRISPSQSFTKYDI